MLPLFCLLLALPDAPEVVRDVQFGYTVTLPAEWKVMPAEQLAQMAQASGVKSKFEHGMTLKEAPVFSYVLVRSVPDQMSRYTFDDLEASMAKEMNVKVLKQALAEQKLEHLVQDMQLGSAYLDRVKKRLVINIDMNMMGLVKLRCLAFGMLGKDGVTFIYCYAPVEEFAKMVPKFEALAAGFAFDAGKIYVEPQGIMSGWLGRVLNGGMNGALIGAAVGGGVALLMLLFRRKKAPTG